MTLIESASLPFVDVMAEFLTMKPSFITNSRNDFQLSAAVILDPFVTSLFPLQGITITEQNNDSLRNSEDDDMGSLFDQNFISLIEKYTELPYKQTANILNNVLREHCGLYNQLSSLSSIYLMLENDLMHTFCEALFQQMDADEPWFDERMMSNTFSEACETSGYNEIIYIKFKDAAENIAHKSATKASFLELIDFKVEVRGKFIERDKADVDNFWSRFLGH